MPFTPKNLRNKKLNAVLIAAVAVCALFGAPAEAMTEFEWAECIAEHQPGLGGREEMERWCTQQWAERQNLAEEPPGSPERAAMIQVGADQGKSDEKK